MFASACDVPVPSPGPEERHEEDGAEEGGGREREERRDGERSSHLDTCEPSSQKPEAPKDYTVSFRTAWATAILHKNQKQDRGWQAAQCEDKHHKAWCCAGSSVPACCPPTPQPGRGTCAHLSRNREE